MFERVLANWPLKLLALGLAFAIWVSVAGERWILQDVQVPLDLELGHDVVVSTNAPTTVSVRLRGRESRMRRLDPVPIALRVDLYGRSRGRQDCCSRPRLVGVPTASRSISCDPIAAAQLTGAWRATLPVEPTFLGRPASGYTVYGTRSAEGVSVEGPASRWPTSRCWTSPIRSRRSSGAFVARVGIVLDRHQRARDARAVDVRVVSTRATERRSRTCRSRSRAPRAAISVLPETPRHHPSGPPKLIEKLARRPVRPLATPRPRFCAPGHGRLSPRAVREYSGCERMRILVIVDQPRHGDGERRVGGTRETVVIGTAAFVPWPGEPPSRSGDGGAVRRRVGQVLHDRGTPSRVVLGATRANRGAGSRTPWPRAPRAQAYDASTPRDQHPRLAHVVRSGGFERGRDDLGEPQPVEDNGIRAFGADGRSATSLEQRIEARSRSRRRRSGRRAAAARRGPHAPVALRSSGSRRITPARASRGSAPVVDCANGAPARSPRAC
jgi:hypothetical protein